MKDKGLKYVYDSGDCSADNILYELQDFIGARYMENIANGNKDAAAEDVAFAELIKYIMEEEE
jgi:hypothetical protein